MNILRGVHGDSVIVLGKVFLWVLMLLFSVWMQHHHSRVRSRGYLRFYRQTRRVKQLPLIIHSIGTTTTQIMMPFTACCRCLRSPQGGSEMFYLYEQEMFCCWHFWP